MQSSVSFLRRVSFAEGISFLVLVCIGMPLKYWAGMPGAVKITGWIHGVLFVLLCAALLHVKFTRGWSVARCAAVFIAALLPLGPFFMDRRIAEWEKEPVRP